MNLLKSLNYNFTQDFFEKNVFNNLYNGVYNKINDQNYINSNSSLEKESLDNIYLIEFVPSFFELKLNNKELPLSVFKYKYFKGFMCDLSKASNVKEYMIKQLGKSGNKLVIRRLKRLETCFDISYKVYCGDIEEAKCAEIIERLRLMIEKRFVQRGDVHSSLKNWDYYKKATYNMILDKKACLFVIYSNNIPISISLDYLYENIFESAISSYEIDYSKFGLGNIIILKKMEWCFDNGYHVFNMRYGDYPYKRYWCNTVFDYTSHVIFNKKSLSKTFKAFLIKKVNQAMGYIIMNKERFVILTKLKSLLRNKNKHVDDTKNNSTDLVFEEIEDYNHLKGSKRDIIDLTKDKYAFLRKYVYDFQYLQSARYDNISIYEIKDNDNKIYQIENDKVNKFFSIKPNILLETITK
ncbi:GNAT family N-acetyltransferase [Flavivirga rizhaonensis]|uniref:GNAT family N-acetyltransferase n=1 Tax=Flavivirga rizhaonensis TaxID=2559571 RepID=A0A4S1E094_9FLAO|nr:GNAT family N-acetyltransferase [Flavivirga rizhaonensis]TGV03920.1 GNAT family N-acetyltransferase [Flavivirga rizhaonensis]